MGDKTIGQFFSGPLVASLLVDLVNLTGQGHVLSAIDPMVGKGDMLIALREAGADDSALYGIDIDSDALAMAKASIPLGTFACNDAFSTDLLPLYSTTEWDLVITNPPYVRYQSLNKLYGDGAVEKVRGSLISLLRALPERDDKGTYLEAAESYSGLSDLAVPSWLLCAYLVKPGGTLAMVMPGSWLTREYASVIRSILADSFELEFIVEDESRCWFPGAQVKTNLFIAKKAGDNSKPSGKKTFRHIGLTSRVSSESSLIGNIDFDSLHGRKAFEKLCVVDDAITDEKYWAHTETTSSIGFDSGSRVNVGAERTPTLASWNIHVGQGLRSGANDCFYFQVDSHGELHNEVLDLSEQKMHASSLSSVLRPALRYQHDLDGSYVVSSKDPCHRLLYIQRPLSSLDGMIGRDALASLTSYVKLAERTPFRVNGRDRLIPSLSAVRTNGPTSDIAGSTSYWYMLPRLQQRHLPALLMPRINGNSPKTFLVSDPGGLVVDANFLTFWLEDHSGELAHAAFALLNSTMVKLELENSCSILGGGALKCEASALKKARLPDRNNSLASELGHLGARLLESANEKDELETIRKIDLAIGRRVFHEYDGVELRSAVDRQRAELRYKIAMRRS